MSDLTPAAYSHDLLARGRVLAEGRMVYLQELYDSGRWRRYHAEQEFLSMVRETRQALDRWCTLAPPSEAEISASVTLSSLRAQALATAALEATARAEELARQEAAREQAAREEAATQEAARQEAAREEAILLVGSDDHAVDLAIDDDVIDVMAMALAEDEPLPSPVDLDELAAAAPLQPRDVSAARVALGESPFGLWSR